MSTKEARAAGIKIPVEPTGKIQAIALTLPFPPSSNRYWRKTKYGRTYVSMEARQYRTSCGLRARGQGAMRMQGDLCVTLDYYRPNKRGDLDNRLKVLLDALNGVAWDDDKQIRRIMAEQNIDKENPRVVVKIVRFDPIADASRREGTS